MRIHGGVGRRHQHSELEPGLVLLRRPAVRVQQVALVQDVVRDLARVVEVRGVHAHGWHSAGSATCTSSARTVDSQVGSARRFLNRCSSSSVSLLILIHALLGKCTSIASRHSSTGIRPGASLLHDTSWTEIRPSWTANTVPLNSSSRGITPDSRPVKYLVEAMSRS